VTTPSPARPNWRLLAFRRVAAARTRPAPHASCFVFNGAQYCE
jgi:hypothetical protein